MSRDFGRPLVARQVQSKHVDDIRIVYMDFAPELQYSSRTISSVTVECPDDTTLTLASAAVITEATTVAYPDNHESDRVVSGTLAANKAVKVTISAGTAQAEDDDPLLVWFHATLNTGEILSAAGMLRVRDN